MVVFFARQSPSSRNLSFRVEFCFGNHNILFSCCEQHRDQFLNVNDIHECSLLPYFQINHVLKKSEGQD